MTLPPLNSQMGGFESTVDQHGDDDDEARTIGSNLFTCPPPITTHTHTHTPHSSLPVGEDWCRWVACWAQCLGVVQDNCVLLGASSGLHLLDSSMVSLAKQSMQQRVFTPTILLHLRYLLKVGWACRFVRPATITQSDTFTPGRCSTHTFCG